MGGCESYLCGFRSNIGGFEEVLASNHRNVFRREVCSAHTEQGRHRISVQYYIQYYYISCLRFSGGRPKHRDREALKQILLTLLDIGFREDLFSAVRE